jgi:hypothetical protein
LTAALQWDPPPIASRSARRPAERQAPACQLHAGWESDRCGTRIPSVMPDFSSPSGKPGLPMRGMSSPSDMPPDSTPSDSSSRPARFRAVFDESPFCTRFLFTARHLDWEPTLDLCVETE